MREAWAEHPLFEVCKEVFLDREVRLEAADVKSEDIFYAVATLLDELWSNDHLTQRDIDNLWRTLYKVIRAYQLDATEPDKRQVAHTVFTIAAKALCHHWRTLYCDTYFYMLQHTMDTEMQKADSEERNRFVDLLIEESSSLSEWVNNVYDGALGKEIDACLSKAKPTKPKSPAKSKEKPSAPPKGKHKAFPFISKVGTDSYRMAQVADLCAFMNKTRADGGPMLTKADQRAFINNFTTGNTSATILWLGTKRQLHFIVSEWKRRKYITFDSDDDIWVITSGVFINGKGVKKDGQPVPFDSDDLGSTHNPKSITQDLEDIVEMLNPEKPSPNYERFAKTDEERIGYPHKAKARKSYQEEEDDPLEFGEFWKEQNGE